MSSILNYEIAGKLLKQYEKAVEQLRAIAISGLTSLWLIIGNPFASGSMQELIDDGSLIISEKPDSTEDEIRLILKISEAASSGDGPMPRN